MLTLLPALAVAIALLGQTPGDPNDLTLLGGILLVALPGISGVVATIAYDGLKSILPWYDGLGTKVHQVVAPVLGFLFGYFVVGRLGLQGVADVAGLDLAWWNASLTTLGMAGIFRFFKRKAPVDASIVLQDTRRSQPISEGGL